MPTYAGHQTGAVSKTQCRYLGSTRQIEAVAFCYDKVACESTYRYSIRNYCIRGKIILIALLWDSETEEVLDSEHTTEDLPDKVKEGQLKGTKTSNIDEENPDNHNDETSSHEHEENHETNEGTRDFEF